MGWKGMLRSIVAAQRRAVKEAERRERQRLKEAHKEARRLSDLEQRIARERQREEIASRLNLSSSNSTQTPTAPQPPQKSWFETLLTIHQDASEDVDWVFAANEPIPEPPSIIPPARLTTYQDEAQLALDTYQPSQIDRLFGKPGARQKQLAAAIDEAKIRDEERYRIRLQEIDQQNREYEQHVQEWQARVEFAGRVLEREVDAWHDVMSDQLDLFYEMRGLGESVDFLMMPHCIYATLQTHKEEKIPQDELQYLASGRTSYRPMSKTRFYEVYQDYVCGATVRVAREIFAFLPVPQVIVTAVIPTYNKQTGQPINSPVLSVHFTRETMQLINWRHVDPSESLNNFQHRMDFKKLKGLQPIEPIRLDEDLSKFETPV